MGVSLPLSLTNTLFFFWISKALEDTRKALLDKNQTIKYQMMQRFTYVLFVGYIICCFAVGGEIAVKFSGERDDMWRYEWLVEMSWYSIFSVFLLAVMFLMKPNANSKLLAYVEELHDTDRNNNT